MFRDQLGNTINLAAKPLGVGGEGSVYDVMGRPDLVAKVYNKPQSKDRCDKLLAMAKLASPDLLKIAAWPTAVLHKGNPTQIDGILMPKIVDCLEIHHLYSVSQRKRDFPEADWGFLLHTARNCAIAFEAVHQHGHVVGDVNQKNVMVSKKGIVAFVDCDSFQVKEGNRIFRCGVGVPEYTPPELHGKNFGTLDRNANHDLFGLGVLIFHLLMMGRHPFSGVPLVKADIPIEKAIQEGLYAYTPSPTKLKPPPNVPPVTMLDAPVLDLFQRAFGTPRRPSATEWRTSLDAAMRQLARCKNDPRHSYLSSAGKCPWCELIASARLMFFIPGQGATGGVFRPEDIDLLIRKLSKMRISFAAYVRPKPILPVQVSLPPGLQSVKKPPLLSHPSPPGPVQRPKLVPLPPPPNFLPRPVLKPLPGAPLLAPKPPLTPHPIAPPPVQEPTLTPLPATRPLPKPPLKPHPLPSMEPPRPKLHPVHPPPSHPPIPKPAPPDPFLAKLCIAGILAGIPLLLVARPVGIIVMVAFAAWWVIMTVTEGKRREMAYKSLKAAHAFECERMDEEYAELIEPFKEANKELTAAWNARVAAMIAKYQRLCKAIDEENYRQLAAWEAADVGRRDDHARACGEIHSDNKRMMMQWEVVDSIRRAEHERTCAVVDGMNRRVLYEVKAKNAETMAAHERVCDEINRTNQSVISDWEAQNNSRRAAYEKARGEIEQDNQRLTSAWESLSAARHAEHDRACREIEARNRHLIADWEAANAPWMAEEKKWRDRMVAAEAEVRRLEYELDAGRSRSEVVSDQRKAAAAGVAASHNQARQDYDRELKQAVMDSKKLQLDEHLDKSLIRHAKLKGITGDRVLSLESFGIETAKDVPLLDKQKVPGIGPVLRQRLFDWRNGLTGSFTPQQTLPESESNRIASRYAPVMIPFGQAIQAAINDLDTISISHRAREAELIKSIAFAVQSTAIAEAHVRFMKLA